MFTDDWIIRRKYIDIRILMFYFIRIFLSFGLINFIHLLRTRKYRDLRKQKYSLV